MHEGSVSENAPAAITRRLAAGERLIWWDRPQPRLLARRELSLGLLFGLFFFAFSVFWITGAARTGGAFAFFGVPFVLVGLWLVSAPVRAYRNAPSMVFGLTDRRALVVSGATVTAFPLDRIDFVETDSLADGAGHVLFYNDSSSSWGPVGWNNAQQVRKSGFLAVAEAERVSHELLAAIDRRRSAGPVAPPLGPPEESHEHGA